MCWRMSRRATTRAVLAGLALAVLAGCRTPLSLGLKEDFLVVERGRDRLRAVAADGSRVRMRQWDTDGGSLEFWREALRTNLTEGRGYVLAQEGPFTTVGGTPGHEMVLDTTINGRPVRYLVALWVMDGGGDDARVRVVEYVADKPVFERHVTGVRQAISRL